MFLYVQCSSPQKNCLYVIITSSWAADFLYISIPCFVYSFRMIRRRSLSQFGWMNRSFYWVYSYLPVRWKCLTSSFFFYYYYFSIYSICLPFECRVVGNKCQRRRKKYVLVITLVTVVTFWRSSNIRFANHSQNF